MEMRKWVARLLVGGSAVFAAAGSLRADDPLREAKDLYATAAYEETLAKLSQLDDSMITEEVDEFRTLCLLALHRDGEAERAMEGLVIRHPLPLGDLDDRSPKFVELYHKVRSRLMPRLATETYAAAKASFGATDYPAAARQFGDALDMLRDAADAAALHDLELLATEFRALAEQRMMPKPPTRTPEPPAAAVAAANIPQPAPSAPVKRAYDIADSDVTPPVVLNQSLPAWNPPWAHVAQQTYAGRLQIVVGENGSVASADIVQPSFETYDGLLLHAAKQWRYKPAMKDGHPVQYLRLIDYVLKSADQKSAQR